MVKCAWSDSQISSGDVVHVFMSSFRRQTLKSPRARFSLCVVNETRNIESRLIRTVSNRSRGCQTLINQCRVASSQTHLVLQAYCLTGVDEINPLGIEIWYRTTRRFSILGGIEAIQSVPKKYRTRYPALGMRDFLKYRANFLFYFFKSSWALLSFHYMWGHTVERNVVPHRSTVLHKYRHTTMK